MSSSYLIVTLLLTVVQVQGGLDVSEFSPNVQELIKSLHSICISKSGTDEESISATQNGIFKDEPKIKAYMRCLLTESLVISDEGHWNLEVAAELLPDKHRDEALANTRSCNEETKDTASVEDRLFLFFKCMHAKNPDLFIFF